MKNLLNASFSRQAQGLLGIIAIGLFIAVALQYLDSAFRGKAESASLQGADNIVK